MYRAMIFDVDGVLVDSPHEAAWGEALRTLVESEWSTWSGTSDYSPGGYGTSVYQAVVSGKPRVEGASALLMYYGIEDENGDRSQRLCAVKQELIDRLIDRGEFQAFGDGVKLVCAARQLGALTAAASSSQNANRMMDQIDASKYCPEIRPGTRLTALFDANVCGMELTRGKPDPAIFLAAARELGIEPDRCVVVEDAPAGVRAAKAGGMACVGVARRGDDEALGKADWVVRDLASIVLKQSTAGHFEVSRAADAGV